MTPLEYLEIENKDLIKRLEKNLLRGKVTKVMIDYAKEYHTKQLRIGSVSDCNMQDFMEHYQNSKHTFTDKAIDVLKSYKR
tara:strand:+ start:2552 stop:2794 length:243 start_codon:yes stop_codon:yes gene_type:complete